MHLSDIHQSARLPKRFPVGTTYVIEGRSGGEGQLRVFSRYVVLPGGRRIDLSGDFGGPASTRVRAPAPAPAPAGGRSRNRGASHAQNGQKRRTPGAKKIMAGAGTSRQHGR
jgi:hypothetical protein